MPVGHRSDQPPGGHHHRERAQGGEDRDRGAERQSREGSQQQRGERLPEGLNADELLATWTSKGEDADTSMADWQTAEVAVHTWDLVRATGQDRDLDPEVAERGMAFMSTGLTDENRGPAFGPEVQVPGDAPVYVRLAAVAGRAP